MAKKRDIAKETYAVPVVPMSPFVIEEWLDDEFKRKAFLGAAFDKDRVEAMALAKRTVRASREFHNHPIPDPEFFGY